MASGGIEAVLLDWGQTLASGVWNAEIRLAGTRVGLEALARDDLPASQQLIEYWNDTARRNARETEDEADLAEMTREAFAELGAPLDDAELETYLASTQRYWDAHQFVHSEAHAFLDTLRAKGLSLAIVSNAITPKRFLDRLLNEQGLLERVDAAVYSCEVGKRKPHRSIFERALEEIAAEPCRSVFIGDKLYQDIAGARAVGMTTILATWFRADATPHLPRADYTVASFAEALAVIEELAARTHGAPCE